MVLFCNSANCYAHPWVASCLFISYLFRILNPFFWKLFLFLSGIRTAVGAQYRPSLFRLSRARCTSTPLMSIKLFLGKAPPVSRMGYLKPFSWFWRLECRRRIPSFSMRYILKTSFFSRWYFNFYWCVYCTLAYNSETSRFFVPILITADNYGFTEVSEDFYLRSRPTLSTTWCAYHENSHRVRGKECIKAAIFLSLRNSLYLWEM